MMMRFLENCIVIIMIIFTVACILGIIFGIGQLVYVLTSSTAAGLVATAIALVAVLGGVATLTECGR